MLLQKIRLKGFLGHRGVCGADGKAEFVEIDFNDSPLWLIHGENGGGKSSLWDALTLSFFEKHRGSGKKESEKLKHLIHEKETDVALIEVEFELNSQVYRICSEISKTGTPNRVLYKLNRNGEEVFHDGNKKVQLWLNENLPFSFQSFTSSILLRQGEADVFLKAKATDRKNILLKLLDLDFYEKLRYRSGQRLKDAKTKVTETSKDLAELPQPTDEEIDELSEAIKTAETELQKLVEQKDSKQIEKKNAEDAEKYRREIAQIEDRKAADEKLFTEAEKIEKDAARFRELDAVLLRLDNFWNARRTFQTEENLLSEKREKVGALERKCAEVSEAIQEKSKAANEAVDKLNQAKTIFEKTSEKQKNLAEKIAQINSVETLERKIAGEENRLAPFQAILNEREEIEKRFDRYKNLQEGLPLLKSLMSTKNSVKTAEESAQEAAESFQNLTEESRQAKNSASELFRIYEKKKASKPDAQNKINDCLGELNRLRGKFDSRNRIDGEDVCSFCGSDLTNDEAKQRIAHEHKNWQDELERLETEENQLRQKFELLENQIKEAEENANQAQSKSQAIQTKLEIAHYGKEHAESEIVRYKEILKDQTEKAGDWANEIGVFNELQNDFESLADAPRQKQNLENALKIESETKYVVMSYRESLGELPQFSVNERQTVKNEAKEIGEKVAVCKADKDSAENDLNTVKDEITELRNQKTGLTSEIKSKQDSIAETEKRLEGARKDSEEFFAAIPLNWQESAEIEDQSKLNERKTEREELRSAENDLKNLQEATDRKISFKAKLEFLETQLNEIPAKHQRDAVEVGKELTEISEKINLKSAEITQVNRQAEEMVRQKAAYEKLFAEQKDEARQLALWQKLADAFGNKGLLAQIVQSAQEKVKTHANDTLGKLSNGLFEIELEDVAETEELKIYVRDWRTESLRLFELFSGGESLLLAVSLAVAIGQATHGRNIANTLIIDEGFGALDEKNRSLMTNELTRLSDILQGIRVIVVSHQNDVISRFPNRYEIGKDYDGFTVITRN